MLGATMRLNTALLLALPLFVTVASAEAQPAGPGAEVRAVGAAYLASLVEDSLFLRMKQGSPVEHLPDLSLARAEARAKKASALLARLEAVPETGLEDEDRLSREMLRRKLRFDADAPRHYWLGFDVTPYASPLGEVHYTFRALPLRTPADADRFLALLSEYPALVGQMRTRLVAQGERGIRIPKDEVPIVKAYLEGALAAGPASPFAVADARISALTAEQAGSFRPALAKRTGEAQTALQGLLAEIETQAKSAPDAVGLSQYPGGRAAYEALVKAHTTLDITPEEVHRIGIEEVARIEARMADVRKKLDFAGAAATFRQSLRNDPRFRAKTADEVGERLMAYDAKIEPKVDAYFLRRPKAKGGVKRLDAEREPALTFGIYEPPSPTEPRGLYRFNGSKLEERSLLTAAALIYHELVPGHHFQISLASENEAIPPFRREPWTPPTPRGGASTRRPSPKRWACTPIPTTSTAGSRWTCSWRFAWWWTPA